MSQILPREKWQAKLSEVFYNEPKHTNSRDALFRAVREFGITRDFVDKFIRAQPDWQVLQRPKSEKNTNTIMRFKPGYIQVDTIDVNSLESDDAKFILTCVDIFTRKLWAYPLENHTAQAVATQLQKLIKDYKLITTIQSDNGKEFEGPVPKLLEENNIKSVKSSPANPRTNAFVERANYTLKRALYGYQQKTGKDPIPNLNDFVESINLQPNATTKVIPEVAVLPQYKDTIIKNMEKYNADKKINSGPDRPIHAGDKVRILLEKSDLPANMKNKLKSQSGYLPKWSFEVYIIKSEHIPKSQWQVPYYTLETENERLKNKQFRRSDLLLVDKDTKVEKHRPKKQLIKEFAEDDDLEEYLANNEPQKMKGASGLTDKMLFRFDNKTKEIQKDARAQRTANRSKLH